MTDLSTLANALEAVAENSERWARGPYNDGPFSEELLRTHNEICGILRELAATLRAALAAGARRAETNEDLAQSEGRQSGPKGNAQKDGPND
jgi:hypothetical protein